MRSFFHFLIFSNIWVATCAFIMSFYTFAFFSLPISLPFLFFSFFATLCSYAFHLYFSTENEPFSPRLEWSLRNKKYLFLLSFVGGIISFLIAICYLSTYYKWFIPLAVLTFLYSAPKIPYKPFLLLRGFGLGKTFYVSFVWTMVTVAFPLYISANYSKNEYIIFFLNRFFLILSVCILFDFKDRHYDGLSKIKNWVTYFDEKKLHLSLAVSAILFGLFTYLLFCNNLIISKLIPFILPEVFLVLALYKLKNTESDIWYYGYLDGILMLSGIFHFLIKYN